MIFSSSANWWKHLFLQSGCELPVSHAMQFSTFHVLTFVILFSNLIVALLIPNGEFYRALNLPCFSHIFIGQSFMCAGIWESFLVLVIYIHLLCVLVEFILGLTGSSIGSLVSIVIPSVLYIAVAKNKEHYTVSYAKVNHELVVNFFSSLNHCRFVLLLDCSYGALAHGQRCMWIELCMLLKR